MEVLCLAAADYGLLRSRYAEHGNSQLRLSAALKEAGADDTLRRSRLLRRMEIEHAIDLGTLCHRFEHRHDAGVHPIECMVMNFVAEWRGSPRNRGKRVLWVMLDRVRQVRDLMEEGQLAREPES